jgi:hypothetical protein
MTGAVTPIGQGKADERYQDVQEIKPRWLCFCVEAGVITDILKQKNSFKYRDVKMSKRKHDIVCYK